MTTLVDPNVPQPGATCLGGPPPALVVENNCNDVQNEQDIQVGNGGNVITATTKWRAKCMEFHKVLKFFSTLCMKIGVSTN
jgi:hypothetical protein